MHATPRSQQTATFLLGAAAATVVFGIVAAGANPGDGTWLAGAVAQGVVTAGVAVALARHLRLIEHSVDQEVDGRRVAEVEDHERKAALQAVADACPTMAELDRLAPARAHQVLGGAAIPRRDGRPDFDAYYDRVAPYVTGRLDLIAQRLRDAAAVHHGRAADDLRTVAALTEEEARSWRGWQGGGRRPRLLHLRQHIGLISHHVDLRHGASGSAGVESLPELIVELRSLDDHPDTIGQVPDSVA